MTPGESTRLILLYAHLLASMLAIARVLEADTGLVTGRLTRERLRGTVRDMGVLLAALWATGLAIVWLDTGFEPAELATRPKLLLKLLAVSVLTLNGAVLHRLCFPILLSDRAPGPGAVLLLVVSGALSTVHWLLAAFVGVARPLGRWPLEDLLAAYALLVAGTVAVAIGCVPAMRRSGILTRFASPPDERAGGAGGSALLNRDQFERRLRHALPGRRSRDRRELMVVVVLELDGVGSIIDRLGRAAGDRVLEIVAERLRASGRGRDLVGRLEGGLFVLMLRVDAGTDFVIAVNRLRAGIVREPVVTAAGPCRIDATIGMAVREVEEPVEQVLRRAHDILASGRARMRQSCWLAPPPSGAGAQRSCLPGTA